MKTALILCNLLTFCAISFGLGLAWERPPVTITKVSTVTQKVESCNQVGQLKQAKFYGANVKLSQAIPASALKEVRR